MGKASTVKRDGRPADGERVVLWGVLVDGQLGSYLFPTLQAARSQALKLRDQMPISTVEYTQVGITLLLRRPLPPKIQPVGLVQ